MDKTSISEDKIYDYAKKLIDAETIKEKKFMIRMLFDYLNNRREIIKNFNLSDDMEIESPSKTQQHFPNCELDINDKCTECDNITIRQNIQKYLEKIKLTKERQNKEKMTILLFDYLTYHSDYVHSCGRFEYVIRDKIIQFAKYDNFWLSKQYEKLFNEKLETVINQIKLENKSNSNEENKFNSNEENKFNSSEENKFNSSEENKFNSSEENKCNLVKRIIFDLNEENKLHSNRQNNLDKENELDSNGKNKLDLNEENRLDSNEENKLDSNEENKLDSNEENKLDSNEENKLDSNEENKLDSSEENKLDSNEENKLDSSEENKLDSNEEK